MAHQIPQWAVKVALRDEYLDRTPLLGDLGVEYAHELRKLQKAGYKTAGKPSYAGSNKWLVKWSRFNTTIPAGSLIGADDIVAFGEDWISKSEMSRVAILRHELVHTRQIAGDGPWLFASRYTISHAWRWAYEVQAYRMSIAVLAMAGASIATQEAHAGRVARSMHEAYSLRRLNPADVVTKTERLLLTEV